jgi:hypothetical protein
VETSEGIVTDDGERAVLERAQAQLERLRREADLAEPPPALLASPLAAELSRLAARLGMPTIPRPARPTCSGCAALWDAGRVHPCGDCAARALVPPEPEELRRRIRRAVPELFRDAVWTNPRLHERVSGGRQRVASARHALATAQRVVIVGPAGAGKSTLAAAHVQERLAAGVERARFFSAPDLARAETPDGGPTPMALALSADVLVLDDIGAELEGAPAKGGLAAQRIGPAMRLIGDRYDRRRGWVITTGFEQAELANFYGDRIARRLFEGIEGTAVIRLGRVDQSATT